MKCGVHSLCPSCTPADRQKHNTLGSRCPPGQTKPETVAAACFRLLFSVPFCTPSPNLSPHAPMPTPPLLSSPFFLLLFLHPLTSLVLLSAGSQIWRALTPLMDNIPGAWDIMMENDPAKLAILRDDLDRQLQAAVDAANASGRGLELAELKPSKNRHRSHSVPNRRSSRLRHPSASGLDLSNLPLRQPSGRKAAATAKAAMSKFLHDDDDDGRSTASTDGGSYSDDDGFNSSADLHAFAEQTPPHAGVYPVYDLMPVLHLPPGLAAPVAYTARPTAPPASCMPAMPAPCAPAVAAVAAAAAHPLQHPLAPPIAPTLPINPPVPVVPSPPAVPAAAVAAPLLPPQLPPQHSAPPALPYKDDMAWLDDFDMDDVLPEPADMVRALLSGSQRAQAPVSHKADSPTPTLSSLFLAAPPIMGYRASAVPAPRTRNRPG